MHKCLTYCYRKHRHHSADRPVLPTPSPTSSYIYTSPDTAQTLSFKFQAARSLTPAPTSCPYSYPLKSIISKTSCQWNIKESCTPSSLSPIPHWHHLCHKWYQYTKTYKTNNELFSDGLPKRAYQELLEAFRQCLCISTNLADGTKLDNGFTELIDYAITHRYPTLEFLSTTGRTTFVEDMTRKYEHVIQRTIQNIETHDFWNMHCNNMLILGRERRKRRGKGQANAQVSFEAAKRAPIDYYYRCKYTSAHTHIF